MVKMRRELVGQLRAKGMTTREIATALAQRKDPIEVTHVTIASDLKALKKQWAANAEAFIGEHIARELAEIEEAKREARQAGNLETWARLLALEMKLLGTDAPQKTEDWTNKDWREYARQHGYSEGEVIAEAQRIIAASSRGEFVDQAGSDPEASDADPAESESMDQR
jgi:DNA-binding transcriptional MerR regulator